jgi:hypothetical protein
LSAIKWNGAFGEYPKGLRRKVKDLSRQALYFAIATSCRGELKRGVPLAVPLAERQDALRDALRDVRLGVRPDELPAVWQDGSPGALMVELPGGLPDVLRDGPPAQPSGSGPA